MLVWSFRSVSLVTGGVAAAYLGYLSFRQRKSSFHYVKDWTKVAALESLEVAMGGLGRVAERVGVGREIDFVRFAYRALGPSVQDTNSVTFCYRQFADSRTLIASPAEESRRSGAAVIFIHGGGFLVGAPEQYAEVAAELADKTGAAFFCIRYRLAPEHPFPAAFDDSLAAVEAIFDEAESMGIDRSRIAIAGDSAGGHLSAAIVQHLRVQQSPHRPKAQVLVYPSVQAANLRTESALMRTNVPLMRASEIPGILSLVFFGSSSKRQIFHHHGHVTERVRDVYRSVVGEELPVEENEEVRLRHESPELEPFVLDYRVSPLLNLDLAKLQLPQSFITACEFDPIRDDALMYARHLEQAGVKVELKKYQTYHGAVKMPNDGKEMRNDVARFLKDVL